MARHPLASLPMYDWPEVRSQTDAFWNAFRDAISLRGIDAPERLDRSTPNYGLWRSSDLLFSQTCGWPLVTSLSDHVTVVGIPTYDVEGCGEGTYRSALVAGRSADPLALARGGRIAFNSRDSLSGYWTLANTLTKGGLNADAVGAWLETGSHRGSVLAVAEGRADLAAIDAVTWRLALDHEPAARDVVVVGWSEELPALPFVTAKGNDVAVIGEALDAAIAASPQAYLKGVAPGSRNDYQPVIALRDAATALGYAFGQSAE